MTELREQVNDYRADYVFLDSVARIFGGNENDRHQVTTFVSWLTAACAPAGLCALGHPGKAQEVFKDSQGVWVKVDGRQVLLNNLVSVAEGD